MKTSRRRLLGTVARIAGASLAAPLAAVGARESTPLPDESDSILARHSSGSEGITAGVSSLARPKLVARWKLDGDCRDSAGGHHGVARGVIFTEGRDGRPQGAAPKRVYLSLGSNLGDRVANIRRAVELLEEGGVRVCRLSSYYKTEPVDFLPQRWFVNCVAEAATTLMPLQLLKALQAVERELGRRPGIAKGPRPIDIDILLYENVVVRSPALTIPHERLSERRFVLVPLRELSPQLRHPVHRRTVPEMLQDTADSSRVVRMQTES